jgi:hypothetical protein
MRLIPEATPPQVNMAAGPQVGGDTGGQRLVVLVIPVPDPGPVSRVEIGHLDPPAIQPDLSTEGLSAGSLPIT